jgi:hypothetical protein
MAIEVFLTSRPFIASSPSYSKAAGAQVAPTTSFDGSYRSATRISHEAKMVRKRQPMAAYRFGGLENTLLQPGESGLMSMIG